MGGKDINALPSRQSSIPIRVDEEKRRSVLRVSRPRGSLLSTRDDVDRELDVPFELAGSEPLATGNVTKCAAISRTFIKSPIVMDWIDNGYMLLWEIAAPAAT